MRYAFALMSMFALSASSAWSEDISKQIFFSDDGRRIASVSAQAQINVWSVDSGRHKLIEPKGSYAGVKRILDVSLGVDGSQLAAAVVIYGKPCDQDVGGTLADTYDVSTRLLINRSRLNCEIEQVRASVDIGNDGSTLAAFDAETGPVFERRFRNNFIRLYKGESFYRLVSESEFHWNRPGKLALISKETALLTRSGTRRPVTLFNVMTGSVERTLSPNCWAADVSLAADQSMIGIMCRGSKAVRIYAVPSFSLLFELSVAGSQIALSPRGDVVAALQSTRVALFQSSDGKMLQEFQLSPRPGAEPMRATTIEFSPRGDLIAALGYRYRDDAAGLEESPVIGLFRPSGEFVRWLEAR
jgi:WD40 repeat protein